MANGRSEKGKEVMLFGLRKEEIKEKVRGR
jgi:hypothetical protein